MIFEKFEIRAYPTLCESYCDCGEKLVEVSNGWLSVALFFCPKCETVYLIKRVKASKKQVTREFLEQCREEVERKCK